MVARINTRKSIQKALNYNEAKVAKGVGELLLASGFGTNIDDLRFSQKLYRFEQLNDRNNHVKTKALHISLNFPPEEDLSSDKLQEIAVDYMERIGFGRQPYLVYRHFDADRPHIHIVTNTIRADGTAISLHNIGKEISEPAREAIEREYGLIPARGRHHHLDQLEGTHDLAAKVQEVTSSYRFTSLEELNAILADFGMTAWADAPGSALQTNRGLVYSRIDESGNKTGVPIKASDLATRPTLKWLEKRFEMNKVRKLAVRSRSAEKLTTALTGHPATFVQRLKNRHLSIQTDHNGNLSTLRVIDHVNKSVFTPEELGFSRKILASCLSVSELDTRMFPQAAKKATSRVKHSPDRRSRTSSETSLPSQIPPIPLGKAHAPGLAGDYPIKKKKKRRGLT
jgi:hypothetical protein